ncbi:hypothetical protein D3C78_399660 [compost metagenome]
MPNKKLRIIIADASLARLIQIEKSLNKFGYYSILPIQFREELWVLSNEFLMTFDVLIANNELVVDTQDNLTACYQNTHVINHALFYGSQQAELTTTSFASTSTLMTCITNTPSDDVIEDFMASIDPPSPWEFLKHPNGTIPQIHPVTEVSQQHTKALKLL